VHREVEISLNLSLRLIGSADGGGTDEDMNGFKIYILRRFLVVLRYSNNEGLQEYWNNIALYEYWN
jgi:hypothetical protein